jgi:hypothetical protein
MQSEVPSHKLMNEPAASSIDSDRAAKSSTRPGPRIIGRLLFCWSWFIAGLLLLVVAPPVLLIGSIFRRQNWITGGPTGARETGCARPGKVKLSGAISLIPNSLTYSFPITGHIWTGRCFRTPDGGWE